jgi:tyrosinase
MYNQPPSAEAKLTDNMGFEPINRNLTIGETMDTIGGTPLCYVYESW